MNVYNNFYHITVNLVVYLLVCYFTFLRIQCILYASPLINFIRFINHFCFHTISNFLSFSSSCVSIFSSPPLHAPLGLTRCSAHWGRSLPWMIDG